LPASCRPMARKNGESYQERKDENARRVRIETYDRDMEAVRAARASRPNARTDLTRELVQSQVRRMFEEAVELAVLVESWDVRAVSCSHAARGLRKISEELLKIREILK